MSLRRRAQVLAAPLALLAIASAALAGGGAPSATKPVSVGKVGNEPLVAVAPDGTVYIAALQYLYVSTNHGKTWATMPLPAYSGITEYKTDSSIAVDPGGRLYYAFDYPYAGATAVCTTDDRGKTWACDPATVPGGTDRMWITAQSVEAAYLTTNEGLYQPLFARSTNRGASWTVSQVAASGNNPYTGPPVAVGGGMVFQPVNVGSKLQGNLYNGAVGTESTIVDTGLPASNTGPSANTTRDGTLYVASEAKNDDNGRGVVVARSTDGGKHFSTLPDLPGASTGTAIFTAVAAGKKGHIGVLYYWTPASADPGSVPATAVWYAKYAESYDANAKHPHWRVLTIEKLEHTGLICRGLLCEEDTSSVPPKKTPARYAGDFLGVAMDAQDNAYLTWMGKDVTNLPPVDPSSNYGVIHFSRVPAR